MSRKSLRNKIEKVKGPAGIIGPGREQYRRRVKEARRNGNSRGVYTATGELSKVPRFRLSLGQMRLVLKFLNSAGSAWYGVASCAVFGCKRILSREQMQYAVKSRGIVIGR